MPDTLEDIQAMRDIANDILDVLEGKQDKNQCVAKWIRQWVGNADAATEQLEYRLNLLQKALGRLFDRRLFYVTYKKERPLATITLMGVEAQVIATYLILAIYWIGRKDVQWMQEQYAAIKSLGLLAAGWWDDTSSPYSKMLDAVVGAISAEAMPTPEMAMRKIMNTMSQCGERPRFPSILDTTPDNNSNKIRRLWQRLAAIAGYK